MSNCRPFVLRLPASIRDEAATLAKADGVSLNHFISLALADHITRVEVKKERRAAPPAARTPLAYLRSA